MQSKWKGLTGSFLKWIAIITMLTDHVGAAILTRILLYASRYSQEFLTPEQYSNVYGILQVTRSIGRIAFPIFCFLLVEGFVHTKNFGKYALRLGIFVFISEIPFDLAFSAKVLEFGYQNVMLTLLIGLLTMYGYSHLERRFQGYYPLQYISFLFCTGAGMLVAYLLKTDYSYKGVLSIMVFYFLRQERILQLIVAALTFYWEPWALAAFPILLLYNGERGKSIKYFFYVFYPLHLVLLYLLSRIMGLEWIALI